MPATTNGPPDNDQSSYDQHDVIDEQSCHATGIPIGNSALCAMLAAWGKHVIENLNTRFQIAIPRRDVESH